LIRVLQGDCRDVLKTLPDESVHCVVTSPPYWGLRDYGVDGQIGLELSPEAFVASLAAVFSEVHRVLRHDGTMWLNLGDSYARMQEGNVPQTKNKDCPPPTMTGRVKNAGLKAKDLVGIPWRVAFALQAAGWWLRQDLIWAKPNVMPESVTDRCTKSHEYIFLLAKSERYYFDAAAIAEPIAESTATDRVDTGRFRPDRGFPGPASAGNGRLGDKDTRNKRSVWTVTTQPFKEAHFATFPPDLIEPCILAGCPEGGTVLDPFGGAGTTGLVADRHKRNAILIELNPEYAEMARKRIYNDAPLFAEVQ
jgi:DNA modification methylase